MYILTILFIVSTDLAQIAAEVGIIESGTGEGTSELSFDGVKISSVNNCSC
jgi:hypothetical protein